MQELATFIEVYFDGKKPTANDLAELIKNSDKRRNHFCDAVLRAIEWQLDYGNHNYSYGELADFCEYFRRLGKRYGLLREFHENGIC